MIVCEWLRWLKAKLRGCDIHVFKYVYSVHKLIIRCKSCCKLIYVELHAAFPVLSNTLTPHLILFSWRYRPIDMWSRPRTANTS